MEIEGCLAALVAAAAADAAAADDGARWGAVPAAADTSKFVDGGVTIARHYAKGSRPIHPSTNNSTLAYTKPLFNLDDDRKIASCFATSGGRESAARTVTYRAAFSSNCRCIFNLLRHPTIVWRPYVLSMFFLTIRLISSKPTQSVPPNIYQKVGSGVELAKLTQIFPPTPLPPSFYRGEKCKICRQFSIQVALHARCLGRRATVFCFASVLLFFLSYYDTHPLLYSPRRPRDAPSKLNHGFEPSMAE